MESTKVTFRRINGRIIPIRSKDGAIQKAPKAEKEGRIVSAIRTASLSGAAGSGATFSGYKVAEKVVDRYRQDAAQNLAGLKRVKAPKIPVMKDVQLKPILRANAEWGNTPFGASASKASQAKVFASDVFKAKTKFKADNMRYVGQLRKYATYTAKRTNLRFQHLKYIRYSNMLSRSMPKAVMAAGLVIGAVAGIANMMNNQNK